MSFDLNFGRADKTVPSLEELSHYFQSFPSFEARDLETGAKQFWYYNEPTGVYCGFSHSRADIDEEAGKLSASGLTFNLNYNRPSFFAFEAMPLVQRFCESFDLLVEDLQEETVEPADDSRLVQSWRMHNERAVEALSHQKDVKMSYMPEERATEWWRYMSVQKKIESSLTEDLFVPTVMIVKGPDQRLFTMIVSTEGIAQFFPRCDYVLVKRERKTPVESKEEMGLVPYEAFIEQIDPYLGDYDLDIGPMKYLSPNMKPEVASAFQNFTLSPIELSNYTRVASEFFHDVSLV